MLDPVLAGKVKLQKTRHAATYTIEELKMAAERRMAQIDALPEEWRLLVHEFGWRRVRALRQARYTYKKAFRELWGSRIDLDLDL